MFFLVQTYVYVTFCSYAFIYFHPWSYILNAQTSSRKSAAFFGITVYAFCMFFWLRYHLFEYILITCLICSRASFSPSSYGKKIHWGRGWLMQEFSFYYLLSILVFSTISLSLSKLEDLVSQMSLNYLTHVNLSISLSSCFLSQTRFYCLCRNTLINIWLSVQLHSTKN